ncbi:assimilatory sulfite reductase (NADPH) flavoprotein subunit [Pontibacillus salicampi]|uniref:Assimilatory sulfite reductase (NADPH) flavoprotein subunit n=1 Tax=Pontibacillus salicampi TaxID=1449801 RepID=A0ABV6LK32_9BACI
MAFQVSNSPFTKEQADLLNQLVPSLNEKQKLWLSGYLAVTEVPAEGEAVGSEEANNQASAVPLREVTILYGSQTGNAQALAEDFGNRLQGKDVPVTVSSMDEMKPKNVKKVQDLLIITSTHGDGDPPDNALSFYEFLRGKRAPQLEDVRFSVLSLGDSSYEFFCQTGIDFDQTLEALGGERLAERVDCDLDFDEPAEAWFSSVLSVVEAPSSASIEEPDEAKPLQDEAVHSRGNPYHAEILENIYLNGRGSNKETRHLELDLEGSGITYEPGDAVGIFPENDPILVQTLIDVMEWDAEQPVPVDKEGSTKPLHYALTKVYEITSVTKPVLRKMVEFTEHEQLQSLLQEEQNEELKTYMYGRDLIDVLKDFGPWTLTPTDFVNLLRKIPPRLYSIASSGAANPDEVHLTIGALRYDAHGRARSGVCSVQCAERSEPGDSLPIFVQKNPNFKLPTQDAPVIMIGAGTGVAPYRAFLEELEEKESASETWLFFGEQHFVSDFLYQIEWQKWLKDGVLSRMDVAFSRDTEEKVYVQHRILEKSKDVYQWLLNGAHVYVCGDETYMAKDVHKALRTVLEQEGNMSEEEAEEYLTTLRKDKRYQRDVY